jgi:DNA-binding NtrC family response regulator
MRPRLLLVEDDPDVRLLVEHVLVDAGYEVDTAATASGGAELLRQRRYDLVLTDGRLPDGTGMQIADIAAGQGMKAIIMTGYAFTMPAEEKERYEILLKPLRPTEIIAAIERALSVGGLRN